MIGFPRNACLGIADNFFQLLYSIISFIKLCNPLLVRDFLSFVISSSPRWRIAHECLYGFQSAQVRFREREREKSKKKTRKMSIYLLNYIKKISELSWWEKGKVSYCKPKLTKTCIIKFVSHTKCLMIDKLLVPVSMENI